MRCPRVEIKSVEALAVSHEKQLLRRRSSGRLIQDGIKRIADGMPD